MIILICAACLYLKGSVVLGFTTIIAALCSGFLAFAYFEMLAKVFINKRTMIPWAHTISFLILFGLIFLILEILITKIIAEELDLGFLAERIGRIICGIFLGLIISGLLITALSMAPLSHKTPYQRFDLTRPDTDNPTIGALNADGFVTGWFSLVSNGSLSGKQSFAAIHPDFLDQAFLTRLASKRRVALATNSPALEAPNKAGIWPAPQELKNADDPNEMIEPRQGHTLTIVRLGKTKSSNSEDGGSATLSQIRLICKQKDQADKPFSGKAKNVYPIGYISAADQAKLIDLGKSIKLQPVVKRGQNRQEGKVIWIDFVFNVPNGYVPVLAEFRQDNIVRLSKPVTAENAPEVIPF